jgi:hypothetical protein
METIEIELPTELVQRLRPYQDNLAHLLELGLRYLEEKDAVETESEADRQRRLMAALRKAGAIGPDPSTIADYLAQPKNRNRQPIKASGRPASEIIIEQRRGLI